MMFVLSANINQIHPVIESTNISVMLINLTIYQVFSQSLPLDHRWEMRGRKESNLLIVYSVLLTFSSNAPTAMPAAAPEPASPIKCSLPILLANRLAPT